MYNSTPSVIEATNGDWLLTYLKGVGHVSSSVVIMRRSQDLGKTWSPESMYFDVDLGRTCMHRVSLTSCPYCGSSEIYASDTRTLWQRVPIVFLLRPVRCHICMRRHYRPIIYPTPKPPLREGLRKKSHTASSEDSVRKNRSA